VRVGAFVRGELQEGLGAGQVVEQLPGLAGEEQAAGDVADQRQAGDLLRDPVAQVVVQEGGAGLPRGRHAECVLGLFHRPPHDRSGLHLPGQLGI
jgi:hypothetical protein